CNGLAFRYYWKRFNRRGWVGALVGIVVSLVFIFLGGLIGAYMRGYHPLEHMPMFVALKQYDPKLSEQIRKEILEGSKNKTVDELGVNLSERLQLLMLKALGQTSDSALLQFGKTRLTTIQEVADKGSAMDCVVILTDSITNVD